MRPATPCGRPACEHPGMRALYLALASICVPTAASAHIHLTYPLSRTDSLLGDQKAEPCGIAGQVRNPARVTTLRPGQTITVTWMETVNHPGWFRIAFHPNGASFGIPPASAGLCVRPNMQTVACPVGITDCNFPTVNQEGPDGASGSIILKDRIADGTLSLDVTLPNMECDNCTLQLIQVMVDKCPYTTDLASDDIYFNCADLTLSASAPDAGVPPDAGGNPGGPDAGDDGGGGGGGGGGCGGCAGGGGAELRVRARARRTRPAPAPARTGRLSPESSRDDLLRTGAAGVLAGKPIDQGPSNSWTAPERRS